nr:VWA domain-containing protein [Myxococcus fulvus]
MTKHAAVVRWAMLLGLLVSSIPGVVMAQPVPAFKEVHVIFLIDRSGSMTTVRSLDNRQRFAVGMQMAREAVEAGSSLPRYMAVWSFENNSYQVHQDFTDNPQLIFNALSALQAGLGTTPLAYSACEAVTRLRGFRTHVFAQKRIELSSDGQENDSPVGSECQGPDSPAMDPQSWQWKVRNKLRTGNAQNTNVPPTGFEIVSHITFFGSFLSLRDGGSDVAPEVSRDGRVVADASLPLPPGGPFVRYLRAIAEESGGRLTVVEDNQPVPALADVDRNGCVNNVDLDLVLANFGNTVPPGDKRADINGDLIVDYNDYSMVISQWGMGGRCNVTF